MTGKEDENGNEEDPWLEALRNTIEHDWNPIYDTVSGTFEAIKSEKTKPNVQ